MVWVLPVTTASETSSGVSQLSIAVFHCTLYPVTAEPPSLAGASQDTSSAWLSWGVTRTCSGTPGTVAATTAVASLVSVSPFPLSSAKEALTLMVLPAAVPVSV